MNGTAKERSPVNAVTACIRRSVLGPSRRSTSRSTDRTLLAYLHSLARHPVMDPTEELEQARIVERTEIEHWVAMLSYPPLADLILTSLEQNLVRAREGIDQSTFDLLRRLHRSSRLYCERQTWGSPEHARRWQTLSSAMARTVRRVDSDRAWMKNAFEIAYRGQPVCGSTTAGTHRQFIRTIQQTFARQRDAKTQFVNSNLLLVVRIASQCKRDQSELMDLIQEGNIGLMKAVDRFEHHRGCRFSTYASFWIMHEIKRSQADKGRTVRVPEYLLNARGKAWGASQSFLSRTGRPPTLEELATCTGLSQATLAKACALDTTQTIPMNLSVAPISSGLFEAATDFAMDGASPLELLDSRRWIEQLRGQLLSLSPLEAGVIRLRFGLEGEELTLKEIGRRCRLSSERIRQIQNQALGKMRNSLHIRG